MQAFSSKLPATGASIFAVMSALAQECDAINLAQGFPNFQSSARLQALVTHFMQLGYNQYAPMPGVPLLRRRISEKIALAYGYEPDPDQEITITAGATQGLFSAITALVRPGDEVILLEPAYDSYSPAIMLQGGIPVPYEMEPPEFRVNWQAVEALVTPRTRLIVANTPHNPSGRVFARADLLALQELAERHNLLVLSDEVYEHLIFDGLRHESALAFPELYRRSLVFSSFGKTFHNTGWKMGYVVGPPALTAEFRKVHQFTVFSVNTPIQHALAEFLADPAEYLSLPGFYQAKRDYFRACMEGTGMRLLPCEGTYFQLADYSEWSDMPDVEFARWLTRHKGVAAIPISAFYTSSRSDRILRFCFAKTEETLAQAAERLRQ